LVQQNNLLTAQLSFPAYLEQATVDHGAKMMAKQIRKSIEDNSGEFGDEIDFRGNVIQSDANWILQRFREIGAKLP
jgi:hypothetical protein